VRLAAELREQVENGFGWWSAVVLHHRWLLIFLMSTSTPLRSTRIPLMQVDSSSENGLFDGEPAKIAYDDFRDQLGRDQFICVVVEPEEALDLEFLCCLDAPHRDIEEWVPYPDEVTSLVNIRSVYSRPEDPNGEDSPGGERHGQELVVEDLLEEMPGNAEEMAALSERVLATPAYVDAVVSVDGRVTALHGKSFTHSPPHEVKAGELECFAEHEGGAPRSFLTARESSDFSRALLEVAGRHRRDDVLVHWTGQSLVLGGTRRLSFGPEPCENGPGDRGWTRRTYLC
jgi:hypothetical protein